MTNDDENYLKMKLLFYLNLLLFFLQPTSSFGTQQQKIKDDIFITKNTIISKEPGFISYDNKCPQQNSLMLYDRQPEEERKQQNTINYDEEKKYVAINSDANSSFKEACM
jgi:hypothetical protein